MNLTSLFRYYDGFQYVWVQAFPSALTTLHVLWYGKVSSGSVERLPPDALDASLAKDALLICAIMYSNPTKTKFSTLLH